MLTCNFVHPQFYRIAAINRRATSHKTLRARDRHTSSTLIGGKGGAGGPSSPLHSMREGPTEYVCM